MKLWSITYLIFLLLFAVFSYVFVDPNFFYLQFIYSGFFISNRELTTLIYASLLVVFFIYYYIFLRFLKYSLPDIKKLKIILLLTVGILILSYPAMLSFDIFNYLATSKVLFFYKENPYIIMPIEFTNDSLLEFTRAANKTALYGPFWILLSAIPYFLGFENFILTLFSFKAFIALFYIGTVYLINKMDKKAAIFFALNPLVLIETLVSGHNDIVMIFFAILAFYLFFGKKYKISALTIVGSMLIKFATLFLIPIFIAMIRDNIAGNKINRIKVCAYSALFMFLIFMLSPLREELYPWYAIWFIAFAALLHKSNFLQNLILVFSFGLMLRYVPYMATGTYSGFVPVVRNFLMIIPVVIFLIFSLSKILRKNAI
ncbi:MAG: hypothetical protein Q7K55_04590 [Candidatus Levybacteria bacterium]|nr:hypothetical protein [Candidatus Levybacteria bacterium]